MCVSRARARARASKGGAQGDSEKAISPRAQRHGGAQQCKGVEPHAPDRSLRSICTKFIMSQSKGAGGGARTPAPQTLLQLRVEACAQAACEEWLRRDSAPRPRSPIQSYAGIQILGVIITAASGLLI